MLNIKKLLYKIIWHIDPMQSGASGTVTVNSAAYRDVCSVTLQPNSKYVVLADLNSNNGSQHAVMCNIVVTSGTPLENFGHGMSRVMIIAGGGTTSWKYIRTGDSTVTVTLRNYGYFTTSHQEEGHLFAWRIGGA